MDLGRKKMQLTVRYCNNYRNNDTIKVMLDEVCTVNGGVRENLF